MSTAEDVLPERCEWFLWKTLHIEKRIHWTGYVLIWSHIGYSLIVVVECLKGMSLWKAESQSNILPLTWCHISFKHLILTSLVSLCLTTSHNLCSTYTQFCDTIIQFYTPCFPSFCLLFILIFKSIAFIIQKWYSYFNCLVLKFDIPLLKCFFFFVFFFISHPKHQSIFFFKSSSTRLSPPPAPPFPSLIKWKWQNKKGLSSEAWF